MKIINSGITKTKNHIEFASMAILPNSNNNAKYNGLRVKRNEPLVIIFVVWLLKFIAVLFFFIITKAFNAMKPETMLIGIPTAKRTYCS